jgi:hypothetical protein
MASRAGERHLAADLAAFAGGFKVPSRRVERIPAE